MVTHIPAVDSEQPTYDMTDKALSMCGGWKIRRNVYYPPEVRRGEYWREYSTLVPESAARGLG